MNAPLLLDLGIAALLVAVAITTIATRSAFAAVVGLVAYGLVDALAWTRLEAVDVAVTEVAVGSLTGVLLLGAAMRLGTAPARENSARFRSIAALVCAAIGAGLAAAVLGLPDPAPTLVPEATRHLPETGLGNPVTATLFAYRALDTLLEKVVLLVGLLAVWSLAIDRLADGRPGAAPRPRRGDPLALLARILPPIGFVVGFYLMWTGADRPGGAFPGSALIAAMWILVRMAGFADAPAVQRRDLHIALAAGPVAFFAVGFAGFGWAGAFLAFPAGWAKPLIVAIEVPMMISVAATLALILEGRPLRPAEDEP